MNKLLQRVASFKRLLRIGKGLALVTSGNVLASIIGGLFWFVIATILPVKDYGIINFQISIASVASLISLLGLNTAVITFVPKGNLSLRNEAVRLSFFSAFITSIVIFIVLGSLSTSVLVFSLTIFTMSWSNAIGNNLYRTYFLRMVTQRISQIAISVLLYFYLGIDGLLLGYAITSLAFSYDMFRFIRFEFRFYELRKKITFISHSYSQALSMNLGLYLDKLIIGPLFGFEALGLYQISFQFLMFLSLIPLSLYQFLLPRESIQKQNNKFALVGIAISIIAFVAFFFLIPIIVTSFFPKFSEATVAARIMILGVIPMTGTSILTSRFLGRETTRPVVLGSIVYLGLLICSEITLGWFFALIGLAVSVIISLFGQCVTLLICLKYTKKNR